MTPEARRTYYREYMRRYRAGLAGFRFKPQVAEPPAPLGCLSCGQPIPADRFFYCSRNCAFRAASARYRRSHRAELNRKARQYRAENPLKVRAANRRWAHSNPGKAKRVPCACGGTKARGTARCFQCRLVFEKRCRRNPNCGIKRAHKHCGCGEPIYRRWDALCVICEGERTKAGLTIAAFMALCCEDELDVAA